LTVLALLSRVMMLADANDADAARTAPRIASLPIFFIFLS
jgi:hypothetical protein